MQHTGARRADHQPGAQHRDRAAPADHGTPGLTSAPAVAFRPPPRRRVESGHRLFASIANHALCLHSGPQKHGEQRNTDKRSNDSLLQAQGKLTLRMHASNVDYVPTMSMRTARTVPASAHSMTRNALRSGPYTIIQQTRKQNLSIVVSERVTCHVKITPMLLTVRTNPRRQGQSR